MPLDRVDKAIHACYANGNAFMAFTVHGRNVSVPSSHGDVLLADWKAAGLLHPSLLRLAKIATIDAELIDKVIAIALQVRSRSGTVGISSRVRDMIAMSR